MNIFGRVVKIKMEGLPRYQEVAKAIGYLSLWAYDAYDEVTITPDFGNADDVKFPDMVAYYKNTVTMATYVIGAIFSNDTYTFHS